MPRLLVSFDACISYCGFLLCCHALPALLGSCKKTQLAKQRRFKVRSFDDIGRTNSELSLRLQTSESRVLGPKIGRLGGLHFHHLLTQARVLTMQIFVKTLTGKTITLVNFQRPPNYYLI